MHKSQESEILYRTLFEQSPYGIMIADFETAAIVEFNNAFCTQLGYTRDEFAKMHVFDFEAAETPEETKRHVAQIERQGGDEFITKHRTKQGEIRDYLVIAKPIELSGKRFLLSIHRDITEQQKTEEELKLRSKLLDSATDSIYIRDSEGNFIYVNETACKFLGYSREELMKMNLFQIVAPEYVERAKKASLMISAGRTIFESAHLRKDGSIVPVEVHGQVIEYEGKKLRMTVCHDITGRKRVEQILTDEAIRRRILIEQSKDGIVILDQTGKVYEANQRFAEMLGYSPDEVRNLSVWDWEFQYSQEQTQEMIRSVDEKGDQFETRHRRKDGTTYDVEISTNGAVIAGQKLIFCVCRDITERKKAEEELKLRAQILDNATDSIHLHDFDGNFIYVNEMMCKSHGYSREELMNMKLPSLIPHDRVELIKQRYQDLIEKGYDTFESSHLRKDGSIIPFEIYSRLIELGHKKFILTIARDITERKKFEDIIKQLAYHDPLTGLPNRTLFNDHVHLAMAHASRYNGKLALLMMDLDKFKEINDTLGHDTGDELLKEVGSRLVNSVRKTDTVSRMGGDEFLLLISEMTTEEDATNVAQKILAMIRAPFMFNGHELNVTPSMGIAIYPEDGKDAETLTKHADLAMYRVKRGGRNGYLRYTPDMGTKAYRRHPSAPRITEKKL